MKRNIKQIRDEAKKRDMQGASKIELLLAGIMFAVEDVEEGLKKVINNKSHN